MASEWVKVELYGANNDGDQRRYTVADGTQVSKGTLLALSDPRTVVKGDGTANQVWAGVASMEKEANDGSTSISVWTNGIFECVASGAIVLGAGVMGAAGATTSAVRAMDADAVSGGAIYYGSAVIGYSLETAADGETINVRLRL